jgi:hypothetical protein
LLDSGAGQATQNSTNQGTTPVITTSFPNELLLAGFADLAGTGAITGGAGWQVEQTDSPFYSGSEDQSVLRVGSYQGTATLPSTDNSWVGIIAAFRTPNTPVSLMSNTGTVTNSTGRVKYRLSVPSSQAAGTYTTVITYTILGTF